MTATRVTVPMLDLAAQYAPIRDEIREVVEKVYGNLKFHPVAKELEAYLGGPPEE